jgi:hypothetical protein
MYIGTKVHNYKGTQVKGTKVLKYIRKNVNR